MVTQEQLQELAEGLLEDASHYVVEADVKGRLGSRRKLTVVLDGDEGISIDACATLSRRLGHLLEEQDLVPDAYLLEVTSPGLDEPLKLARQYPKNVGRLLEVTKTDGTKLLGTLLEVGPGGLTLEPQQVVKKKIVKGEPLLVPLEDVVKAVVQVQFKA